MDALLLLGTDTFVERGLQRRKVQPLHVDVQRRQEAALRACGLNAIAEDDDAADARGDDDRERYESAPGARLRSHVRTTIVGGGARRL